MFGRLQEPMTKGSDHILDWSRTAELLLSESHRYSPEEILARLFVIVSIVAGGALAYQYNDPKKTEIPTWPGVVGAALLGFVLSHFIVLIPLIQKRREMRKECEVLKDNIMHLVEGSDCKLPVKVLVDYISSLSLTTAYRGNASLTWGTRKRLLTAVHEKLKANVNADDWQELPFEIVHRLDAGKLRELPESAPAARL